jgi:hypothetical protein
MLKYEEIVDGELIYEETTEIEVVSLNGRLSADVFQLEGMNLPVPTPIGDYRERVPKSLVWDGSRVEALAASKFASRREQRPFEAPRGAWLWVLIFNAIVVIGLSVVIIRRMMARSRHVTH